MSELVKGVPRAQYERERADAKRRNREACGRMLRAYRLHRLGGGKPGKLAEVAPGAVRWLPEPVAVGGLRIVGVCADASDDVKAAYL